jgi:hypothetical protein
MAGLEKTKRKVTSAEWKKIRSQFSDGPVFVADGEGPDATFEEYEQFLEDMRKDRDLYGTSDSASGRGD